MSGLGEPDENALTMGPPGPPSTNGNTENDASSSMMEGGILRQATVHTSDAEHYVDLINVDTDDEFESPVVSNIVRQRYTRIARDDMDDIDDGDDRDDGDDGGDGGDLEAEPAVYQTVNLLRALDRSDEDAPTTGRLGDATSSSIDDNNADEPIEEGNATPRAVGTPLPRITSTTTPSPSGADPGPTPTNTVDALTQTREQLESNAAQSTALLSSLLELRTNLQTRVEALGQEVDRLRRRAEELERGLIQDGTATTRTATTRTAAARAATTPTTTSSDQDEQDSRARAFRDANNRVRALRLLRQERSDRVDAEVSAQRNMPSNRQETADSTNAARVFVGEGVVSGHGEGTGGRRELDESGQAIVLPIGTTAEDVEIELLDSTAGKKRGSGSFDMEGDRMWRRERRMASYLSLSTTLKNTSTAINIQSIAAVGRPSSNIISAPTPSTAVDSRSPFRFSPHQRSRSRRTPDGVPQRIYTPEELERLRHPARSFGTVHTPEDAESLTSRGRRVANTMSAASPPSRADTPSQLQPRPQTQPPARPQQQPRALPTDARTMTDTEARNNIRTALTRYRDALMSVPPETTTERDLVTYRLLQRAYTQVATGTPVPEVDADIRNREEGEDQQSSQAPVNLTRVMSNEQTGVSNAVVVNVNTSNDSNPNEDISITTEFADDGAATSNGANLSRRVTLRLPPARTNNPVPAPRRNVDTASGPGQTAAGSGGPRPTSEATQTLNQLAVLSQTIQSLTDRLEVARRLARFPTEASRSARVSEATPTPSRTRRNGEAGSSASPTPNVASSTTARTAGTPAGTAAGAAAGTTAPSTAAGIPPPPRRPTHPASHNINHPHHRPRIGPDPIAAVINCDNHNSFDINFDGNVVFRPVAARLPDRELIARCLSMLPGGRDNVPSRWMRLTGDGTSRARRPTTTAGFWVRWVSGPDVQPYGLRLREMRWNNLPPIVAFQFSACPPEDDAWLRADEVEFYTPRTRLRQHLGPWMHSRVRRAPFETDPPIARWGTSAHVRQTVDACGGLQNGDFITLNLLDRTVEFHRASDATTRQRTIDSAPNNNPIPVPPVPPTPVDTATNGASTSAFPQLEAGEEDRDASRWLNVYEPAISQIRMDWRTHYRRSGLGPLPLTSVEQPEDSATSGTEDRAGRAEGGGERVSRSAVPGSQPTMQGQQVRWSRDFLDADGELLPPAVANRALRSDVHR